MKKKFIYRIVEIATGKVVPCYFQFRGDIYDFDSVNEARDSNCHGVFQDKTKYRIIQVEITETIIQDYCD